MGDGKVAIFLGTNGVSSGGGGRNRQSRRGGTGVCPD